MFRPLVGVVVDPIVIVHIASVRFSLLHILDMSNGIDENKSTEKFLLSLSFVFGDVTRKLN